MARNSLKSVMKLIDAAKKTLPIEQEFLHDLKRSVELTVEKESNGHKPSQTYKPSSMQCIRQMYYQVAGKEPDPASSSFVMTGIVNSGSDIHVRMQTAVIGMKENNIDCEYVDVEQFVKQRKLKHLIVREKHGAETKLYHKDLNISFMCDGIIKYKNHYYILEFKTETAHKWWDRNGVDSKHYNQAIAYSLALEINEVIFVYVSRDMLDAKAYLFTVTDEMKQELVGKIEECDGYVKRLIAPPKPEDITRKICTYCSYRGACKRDG